MRTIRTVAVVVVMVVAGSLLAGCSSGNYHVTATFDDAGDLQSRGSVQVADVRVGSIGRIKLTKDFRATVSMSLNKGVRIPKDSTAYLRTTSLLGEKFVELRPNGDPGKGPYLRDGDQVAKSGEAPELEFVAEQAVSLLGAVTENDVATLVDTGAEAFGGRGPELKTLITDISSISATLASRTAEITRIIDHLGSATATLAANKDDIANLLSNLSQATTVLSNNRQQAVDALASLSRLARVQDTILDKYRSDVDRQIKQVDGILGAAAAQSAEVGNLIDWLNKFALGLPKAVPNDFTQVYMWLVPASQDPRVGK
jgi:phospholipid/cholesterol/gamma-HCH transport system substrate-binding protein